MTVLLVESDPAETELLLEILGDARQWGHDLAVTHVGCISAAVALLGQMRPHAIVLDLHPPDALHLDALRRLRAASHGAPVIVLTGIEQPALARDAIRLGAEEYLLKRALDGERLVAAVLRAVERARVRRAASEVRAAFRRTLSGLDGLGDPVHPRPTRVDSAVRGVVALFDPSARAKGVGLRLDLDAREVELETDPLRLRELLVELVGRAVRDTESGAIDVTLLDAGTEVVVEVGHLAPQCTADDLGAAAMAFWPGDAGRARPASSCGDAGRLRRVARLIGGELQSRVTAGDRRTTRLRLPRRIERQGGERPATLGTTILDGGSNR